ncbi:hypothetical protein QFC22_002657 [Naganishia vaughanmartiniae]|uniref:Uncharacterized protein n=1 Tax=Naganishia vaughanmartiniae TaxID=1424756 RepID=A0ACC2XAR6_9TREE|nr:hypothetical protein QFC22_002657 [Naganishia vaughanmartiniae]
MAFSSSSTLVHRSSASIKDVKKNGMDAMSLSKWNRLAEKGGIGTAVAFYHEDVQFVQNSPSTWQPGDSSTSNVDPSPGLTMNSSVPDQTTPTLTSQPPDSAPSYEDHKPSFTDDQQEAAAQSPSMSSDSSNAFHTDNYRPISPNDNASPTRSLAPSLNSSNRTDKEQVQAVALALKTFAKDHHDDDLDVHDGLRSRQSRRSSTENSDATWSSADEDGSDEDSEASIRYPTTISFIDRIKALRIPMTAAQEIQSSIPQHAEPPNLDDRLHILEANTQDGTLAERSMSSLETPEIAAPMYITPPPRPEKSQFRDQQLTPSENSGTARGDNISSFDDIQAPEPHDIQQTQAQAAIHLARAIGTTSSRLVEEREKPALTFTRESSQFEFSSGLSGSSTPSGIDKLEDSESSPPEMPSPPNHESPRQASEFASHTVDADEDIPNASNLLQIPEPVAREIANRFSTASDVLRKNYVNDVGVQSYFPVVDDSAPVGPVESEDALPSDSEGALAEQAGDSFDTQPIMGEVEDQDDSISTTNDAGLIQVVASEVETSSHQTIFETPLVGASRGEASHTPVEPEIAGAESDDEWDVSKHYAGISNSPPLETAGQLSARRHVSVLSDSTNTINGTKVLEDTTPIDMDKKAGKGILKVHTSQSPSNPQQPGFSPQPVRTPIDVQALRNTSLETSLSPDTARFRAFNFVSASATGTPTKTTGDLDVYRSALSPDGQQSTVATQLVQDDTLHGQLSMDLASARHPVPINFLLGHSVYSPHSETRNDSPLYGTPDTKSHQGDMDTFSPSPTLSRPSPSAPSSPFFPSSSKNLPSSSKPVPSPSEKPRARSFSKVEVIVPLHRSASANSLKAAYAGVPIQTPAEMNQHQDRENRAGGSRRSSLSRTGSSKLSAIRRKLSLKGEQRPDMAAILAKEDAPPLPTSSHSTPTTSHTGREPSSSLANSNTPEKKGTGVRNLVSETPPSPATIGLGLPPLSIDPKNSFKVRTPVSHDDYRSPSIVVAEANFQMDDLPGPVASNSPIPDSEPIYDEYGFLASETPVPQSFATMRPPEKEVSKIEKTLVRIRLCFVLV